MFKLPANPRLAIESHCRMYGDWEVQTNEKIAEGAYGKVYRACRGKDCSHFIAKEILFYDGEPEDMPFDYEWYWRHFVAESQMTQFGARHNFAVPLYDYFLCGENGNRGVMLMEKYDGDIIKYSKTKLNERDVTQILGKIQAMHDSGIWHGDLYTKNVVYKVKQGRPDAIDFRFIDFGLSIPFGTSQVPAEARAVDYMSLASSLGRPSLYDKIVAHSIRVNGIEAHNRAVEWVKYLGKYTQTDDRIIKNKLSSAYGCAFEYDLLRKIPDSVFNYYGPAMHILFAWTTYCNENDQLNITRALNEELKMRNLPLIIS